jgi:hypothetical protein
MRSGLIGFIGFLMNGASGLYSSELREKRAVGGAGSMALGGGASSSLSLSLLLSLSLFISLRCGVGDLFSNSQISFQTNALAS